ncbi:MAG TPA: hypothetical protein VGD64_01660 [Acidisarcina sp.]
MPFTKVFSRIFSLVLAIGVCVGAGGQAPSKPTAKSSPKSTLVLKIEAAGAVSVDGKLSNAQAGQILTLSLQPGQHLVSLKTADGKTVEKLVTLEVGRSIVELLGDQSVQSAPPPSEVAPGTTKTPPVMDLVFLRQKDVEKLRIDVRLKALDKLELYTDELDTLGDTTSSTALG